MKKSLGLRSCSSELSLVNNFVQGLVGIEFIFFRAARMALFSSCDQNNAGKTLVLSLAEQCLQSIKALPVSSSALTVNTLKVCKSLRGKQPGR